MPQFKLYLFENIVVFAKEVTSKKQKLLAGGKPPSIASSKGTSTPRLNLKGRVYMLNLDSVTKLVKPGETQSIKCRMLQAKLISKSRLLLCVTSMGF